MMLIVVGQHMDVTGVGVHKDWIMGLWCDC